MVSFGDDHELSEFDELQDHCDEDAKKIADTYFSDFENGPVMFFGGIPMPYSSKMLSSKAILPPNEKSLVRHDSQIDAVLAPHRVEQNENVDKADDEEQKNAVIVDKFAQALSSRKSSSSESPDTEMNEVKSEGIGIGVASKQSLEDNPISRRNTGRTSGMVDVGTMPDPLLSSINCTCSLRPGDAYFCRYCNKGFGFKGNRNRHEKMRVCTPKPRKPYYSTIRKPNKDKIK